jgi:hypothetical protein
MKDVNIKQFACCRTCKNFSLNTYTVNVKDQFGFWNEEVCTEFYCKDKIISMNLHMRFCNDFKPKNIKIFKKFILIHEEYIKYNTLTNIVFKKE